MSLAAARNSEWPRRYPPLLGVGVAIALAIWTLPSALNLPQANPGQVAEYAPVPGNGNSQPPGGNFAGLGLGQGGSAEGGAGAGTGAEPGQPPTSAFNCVGNPPRQTADVLAPPCVPTYSGNNGGSTWVGVTAKEITVVFRFVELQGDACHADSAYSSACGGAPSGFYDLDNPSTSTGYGADFYFMFLHIWSVYFNSHYQTYGRHVHFWVYNFGSTTDAAAGYTQSNAAAEAAQVWDRLHPFANVGNWSLYPEVYTPALAQHNVLNFGYITDKLAAQYPALYWNFAPPVEYVAQLYASFVCQRVIAPGRVTFTGNSADRGKPRKIGLLLTDDPAATQTRALQQFVVQDLKNDCGFQAAETEYYHYTGAFNTAGPKSGWGVTNMAKMRSNGITTIL